MLVVLGPTGTGKSALALELAARLGGEIVGCDALQVYRRLDAATAKPTAEEREKVPHHLIDYVDPGAPYSLADYVRDAERAIEGIAKRGRVPLVVGGSGMYLRGLLRGIVAAPPADLALRQRLRDMARRWGSPRLHRCLRRRDAAAAARIAPGDTQRIVRGLDLVLRGDPGLGPRLRSEGTWHDEMDRYPAVKIGLDASREILRPRLDARVERFFSTGLVEEVRALLDAGLAPRSNSLKAIGYREIVDALALGGDVQAAPERVKAHTWRFVKRQRTWFRKEPGVSWFDAAEPTGAIANRAQDLWLRS